MSIDTASKTKLQKVKTKNDDIIEWQFVKDYADFALGINFSTIEVLLKSARAEVDLFRRKQLCLSGLQSLYSGLEDFALLLHAFQRRAEEGKHLHLSLGVEDQDRKGSTGVPRLFKRFVSSKQSLEDLGFSKVTLARVRKFFDISQRDFDSKFMDLAEGVRSIADYQDHVNVHKNKLKHGKAVLEGEAGKYTPDDVIFLRWSWDNAGRQWILEKRIVEASVAEVEKATRNVAQLYVRSLELLWMFMLNYWPQHHEGYLRNVCLPRTEDCGRRVKALGLSTAGIL